MLINTSRGAVIDEEAMLQALDSGRLAGAGLDIIDGEWRSDYATHPVLTYARSHKNLIVAPHIGGVTYESQSEAFMAAAKKLVAFLRPHPISLHEDHHLKRKHGPDKIQTTLKK